MIISGPLDKKVRKELGIMNNVWSCKQRPKKDKSINRIYLESLSFLPFSLSHTLQKASSRKLPA